MGLHYYFCLEERDGERWRPCTRARPREDSALGSHSPAYRADFTWLHRRSPALPLFFGELFEMHATLPPDAEQSSFFAHHLQRGGEADLVEMQVHWISVADLCLDEWPSLSFVMRGRIAAAVAGAFGDGRGALPMAALRAAGINDTQIDELAWRAVVGAPAIDQHHGKPAYVRRAADPELPVDVTWSAPLREILGADRFTAFVGLQTLASPEDLRVIAYLG
ncbi:MAG: hypothetical protein AAF799_15965 [Myxococcota bacterium]